MKRTLLVVAGVIAAVAIVAMLMDNSPNDLWEDVLDEI